MVRVKVCLEPEAAAWLSSEARRRGLTVSGMLRWLVERRREKATGQRVRQGEGEVLAEWAKRARERLIPMPEEARTATSGGALGFIGGNAAVKKAKDGVE
jgi:hypothetical protein